MNKSIYLDSTIPSYLFDERYSIKTYIDVTRKWWEEERNNFDLYVSEESIIELSGGDYPNKQKLISCVSEIQVLEPDASVFEIAQAYLDNYLMPQVLAGDAIHLAYASYYKIDFLLTWNCNHLANANKKQHIRIINTRLGLLTPEIITPLELFTETI
ncbi:MAG: PIN domain-containing protein [Methylococcaceae bacterium]|nr:MAG: PIN domain-containing protein [Methylococcaceae bacterium]